MKLLATGDWQAGVATVDLADQEAVWHRIVDVAIERKVDAFLHGGDLVEGPVFTMEQLAAVRRVFARIREAEIPLLIIKGNSRHDLSVRPVHALDVFRDYEGISVCDTPTVAILADKVAVCALPWVHPGRLIASMNGALTHEQADATTSELLVRIARHLHGQAAQIQAGTFGRANLPTVLLAHWAISGSALPTGLPVDEMREPILSWPDLDTIGYDAVVGAHIHQPQQISNPELDSTLGIVCGSPQQLNHGEHGEHGCWILDLGMHEEKGWDAAEFVPIESRRFVTMDCKYDGDYIQCNSPDGVPEGANTRVRWTLTEEEARRGEYVAWTHNWLDTTTDRIKIEPTIIRKERARAQQINEQLGPLDALAAYCDSQDMPTDLSLRMLERLKEWNDG